MRIIEGIIEAIDPIGANISIGGHTEGPSKGEGDNKIIIEANFKVTTGSLILLMVVITIITTAIIEVAVAGAVTFIDHMAAEEAITEAITTVEQYGPPCTLCGGFNHSPKHCFKGEHDINNLMEKMSLGSNNQHQIGLYQ